jgi:hypothetical protein
MRKSKTTNLPEVLCAMFFLFAMGALMLVELYNYLLTL